MTRFGRIGLNMASTAAPLLWLIAGAVLSSCADEVSHPAGPSGLETPPPEPTVGPALKVRVRSSDGMDPLPARLIINGVPPTPAPKIYNDGATAQMVSTFVLGVTDGAMLATGEGTLTLPAGTYDVQVLQGPEYETEYRRVTITGQQIATLDVVLEHSVRTNGWLAADMHIHTSRSFDSKLAPAHRVISEVAAGIQVVVPTDHIFHNDLQDYIYSLGYSDRAVSIPGSEYGFAYGHLGVYPVHFDPRGALWGAPAWQVWENWRNLPGEVVFPMIHGLPGQPVIVINHPRLPPDLGYFRNVNWPRYPGEPLSTEGLFDGMEVLNGYHQTPEDLMPLLRDWFYFLSQGRRVAALGNSDTHRMDWLTSGYPRTWLRMGSDVPSRILPSDLRDALAGMRAVASNGPWLNVTVDGAEIGSTIQPTGATVTVRVTADAAGWIDLQRVQLYQNGMLVKEWSVPTRNHPAFVAETTLPATEDGWIVAMVVGEQPLPATIIGAVGAGRVRPIAMTNPVWIDINGDGKIDPKPLVEEPRPFGPDIRLLGDTSTRDAPQDALPLHVPLDCEPDSWQEWLVRHSSAPQP